MVLKAGTGSFKWNDKTGNSALNKPLDVYYYRPETVTADTPVWIITHGQGRNAANYRDFFVAEAAKQGALVIAPEFNDADWKGNSGYNLGNIATSQSNPKPTAKQDWSFSKIEPLFDYVVKTLEPKIKTPKYDLFGHSAGAQLVHRFLAWVPNNRVNIAIAANAGSYAIPQSDNVGYKYSWPYSTVGTPDNNPSTAKYDPFPVKNVKSYLNANLVVLLGEKDTKRSKSLPKGPAADAQGQNRVERGQYFYQEGQSEAKAHNIDCNWKLQTVKNVGHNGRLMGTVAAELFKKADAQLRSHSDTPPSSPKSTDLVWENLGLKDEAGVASGSTFRQNDGLATTVKWKIEKTKNSKLEPSGGKDFVSYEKDSQGGERGYLNLGFNNRQHNPSDKVKLSIDFNRSVTGLSFDILDVDSGKSFDDCVEIFVDGTNVRELPDIVTLGGSRVKLDDETYIHGFEGNGSSGKFSTQSNVHIGMSDRAVSSIDIFYAATDDAVSNPTGQNIGLSDLHWR